MISQYKKRLEPFLAIIARPFISWNPSILTFLSLMSALLFFLGIITHLYILSIVSIFGFLFDMLDGYVARKNGKTSAFGAFLDSTLDRISDFLFVTSFGFGHLVRWELVIIVLSSAFLISYIQARGEAVFHLDKRASGLMQRSERIVILLLGFFLFLLFPYTHPSLLTVTFIILFILSCITILQRFWAIKKVSENTKLYD